MKAVLERIVGTAANIKTFWFKPQRPMHWQAGQFTELRLPHPNHDKRGEKRWFTVSASPTEGLVSITTKFTGDPPASGGSSFKKTLYALRSGTEVNLAEPMGDFVLPKDSSRPLVFVAGGIGVTPFRSIIKFLSDTGEKRDIQLLYAANKLDEVAFHDIFKQYGLEPKIILGEPPAQWTGLTGRLSADIILDNTCHTDETLFYLSGPEPMVEVLDKDLKAKGLNKHHIVTDFFPGYTDV